MECNNILILFVALTVPTFLSGEPTPIARYRVPVYRQPVNSDPMLSGQWFLCRRGDKVEACRHSPAKALEGLQRSELNSHLISTARKKTKSCREGKCFHGSCSNNRCTCDIGWRGKRCQKDINECKLKARPCSQRCRNTEGSYICQCWKKFILQEDGRTCMRRNRHRNSTIISLETDFNLLHPKPKKLKYKLPQRNIRQYPPAATSTNRLSSRSVQRRQKINLSSVLLLNNSVILNQLLDEVEIKARSAIKAGQRLLVRVLHLRKNPTLFTRIRDPCFRNKCQQKCIRRTMNRAMCVCRRGYRLEKRTKCVDINECLLEKSPCPANTYCSNKEGGYSCQCSVGYASVVSDNATSKVCLDINECLTGEHLCHSHSRCVNMPGYHICECLDGFVGDGVNCDSVNATAGLISVVNATQPIQSSTEITSAFDVRNGKSTAKKAKKLRKRPLDTTVNGLVQTSNSAVKPLRKYSKRHKSHHSRRVSHIVNRGGKQLSRKS